MSPTWSLRDAVRLATMVEDIAPRFNCHVALTGGCLYKPGDRKDVDLLFYRIRQAPEIDREGLLTALQKEVGIQLGARKGWVRKATFEGADVDLFFPELPAEWDSAPSNNDRYNYRGND